MVILILFPVSVEDVIISSVFLSLVCLVYKDNNHPSLLYHYLSIMVSAFSALTFNLSDCGEHQAKGEADLLSFYAANIAVALQFD